MSSAKARQCPSTTPTASFDVRRDARATQQDETRRVAIPKAPPHPTASVRCGRPDAAITPAAAGSETLQGGVGGWVPMLERDEKDAHPVLAQFSFQQFNML